MSALDDLVGRNTMYVGGKEAAAELAQLRAHLKEAVDAQRKYLRLNVGFHNSNVALRADLAKARKLLADAQTANTTAMRQKAYFGAWTWGSPLEQDLVAFLAAHPEGDK